jgi:uncharacterized protein YdeI (YjbR/CyaY-like superfamily)
MVRTEDFDQVQVQSAAELRSWLLDHHEQHNSVWLVTSMRAPAGSLNSAKYVSRDEVLDELVSFGWIDGIRRKLDDERTMQLITPRRVQHWSKTYKDRAAALIGNGRMHASGLAAIELSKRNGLWNFMDDVDAPIAPDDLIAALDANEPARQNYEAFPPSTKRNTLRWIKVAKTEATRTKRITMTVQLAADSRRIPNT